MSPTARWTALCVCAVLLLCHGTRVSAAFIRSRRMEIVEMRTELVALINNERKRHDKVPVCTNRKLVAATQVMAEDMARSDYFGGTGVDTSSPAERVSREGFVFTTLTEDVAAGYESAQAAFDALLKEPEHRDNILGDYEFVGAGYKYNRRQGYKHFWALNFANAIDEFCDEPEAPGEPVENESLLPQWLRL